MSTARYGATVCSYTHCKNNSKNCESVTPRISFFKFPVQDKDRCMEWIVNSGRQDFLELEDRQLNGRRICSAHFLPSQILNKRLMKGATPKSLEDVHDPSCSSVQHNVEHVVCEPSLFGLEAPQYKPPIASGEGKDPLEDGPVAIQTEEDELPAAYQQEDKVKSTPPPDQPTTERDALTDLRSQRNEEVVCTPMLDIVLEERPIVIKTEVDVLSDLSKEDEEGDSMSDIDSDHSSSTSDEESVDYDSDFDRGDTFVNYDYDDPDISEEVLTPKKLKIMSESKKLSNLKKRVKAPAEGVLENRERVGEFAESENARVFLAMQTRSSGSNTGWTKAQQNLALSFYYKSPTLYMYMKNEVKLKLPSYSTLINWMKVDYLSPGFCEDVFERLAVKVSTMSESERECVLLFSKMSIKKWLEYDSRLDLIDGYEDLGPLGRFPFVATQATVFMIRGLKHDWTQHVAYFLAFIGIKVDSLASLISQCIEKLSAIGLKVRVTVAEQGTSNSAFNLLGATVENPYFFHKETKIYAIFDVPHLLKSVRDTFVDHDLLIDERTVSWRDIILLFNIEAKKGAMGTRNCPKLTANHVFPGPLAKTSVKLASQVFSHSVEAGLQSAMCTGELDSVTVEATKEFVGHMNDLFDSLNSFHFNDPTLHRRPLSNELGNASFEFLSTAREWLETWKVTRPNKKSSIPPCANGLQMTVNGILLLWSDLCNEGTAHLLTARLNLDPLENSFVLLRNKFSHKKNPSSKQFRQNLKQNMLIEMMNPPRSCEPHVIVHLKAIDSEAPALASQTSSTSNIDNLISTDSNIEPSTGTPVFTDDPSTTTTNGFAPSTSVSIAQTSTPDDRFKVRVNTDGRTTYGDDATETCPTVFLAGWLGKKCISKFDCEQCKIDLLQVGTELECTQEVRTYFQTFLKRAGNEFDNLMLPSDEFSDIISAETRIFSNAYELARHHSNVRTEMRTLLLGKHPRWFEVPCYVHRRYMLEKFLRVKMFDDAKKLLTDIRDVPTKAAEVNVKQKEAAVNMKQEEASINKKKKEVDKQLKDQPLKKRKIELESNTDSFSLKRLVLKTL